MLEFVAGNRNTKTVSTIINVLCDPVGRYHDDGRLVLRPGGKEKEPTSVGSRTQAQ